MNTPGSPVIETHGLAKSYKDTEALRALDLCVPKHSIFAFLGPNGSGKTTTIKLLLGLAKPTGGSGTVFGLDIARESTEIRRRVGYLAQDPRYYEHLTARETLRFTIRFFFSGPPAKIEARIADTLELVGLAAKADRRIRGFSGGERQRLGIAQAQINHPDLLILDEPAASLDPQGRHDVLAVMERLRKHTTIFYSTHILSDVQRVSDRVAILNRGELVAEAPIEQLLSANTGTAFHLTLRGELEATHARLMAQPWVSRLEAGTNGDGRVRWKVSVTDVEAAEAQLQRLVLQDPLVQVIEFGRKQFDLEEVFLGLVEGDNHGR